MNTDEIKRNVNLPDLARSYGLKVDRAGKCRCPFHNDRTPSMKVWTDHYFCFGCGTGGDVFEFTMKMEHCDFGEAVQKLGGTTERPSRQNAIQKVERYQRDRKQAQRRREMETHTANVKELGDQLSKLRATLASAEPFSQAYCFAADRLPVVEYRYEQALAAKWEYEDSVNEHQ